MAAIQGEPTIRQNAGNVFLEVVVKSSSEMTIKWAKDDKPVEAGDDYKMSTSDEGGGRTKIICEILVIHIHCFTFLPKSQSFTIDKLTFFRNFATA